ncbi:radical SAM protein [bacterium]|nr:radical SAM protein [candidate division CSSED10-310 bacterium]
MKVALIVPPWTYRDIRAHDTQGIAGAWPPIGSLYIAAVLRERGHEVIFRDGAFYTGEELTEWVDRERPDVLGAFVIAMFWDRTKTLFKRFKERLPALFLVAGGHGPTALGEQAFIDCPELDAIIPGEAEYGMRDLVERLAQRESLLGVQGSMVREDGVVVRNPPRPFIDNLDELPFPAMDLAELDRYRPSYGQVLHTPSMQVISSRGCMNECLYCYRLMGRKVLRFRSAVSVVDEVQHYVEHYGVRDIKFWDECFTHDKWRTLAICNEILNRGLKVSWWISARADAVDRELLTAMKRAGCWCINFGVESAIQKNLDMLRKNLTVEQIIAAVKLTHEVGIETFTTYIFGIPGETFEEGLETIRLAKDLNSYLTEFFPISPFPGTDLWNDADQYGVIKRDMSDIGLLKEEIPFAPYTMTVEQVSELRRRAFREYYIRPRYVWKFVSTIRSIYQVKMLLNGARTLLFFTSKRRRRAV